MAAREKQKGTRPLSFTKPSDNLTSFITRPLDIECNIDLQAARGIGKGCNSQHKRYTPTTISIAHKFILNLTQLSQFISDQKRRGSVVIEPTRSQTPREKLATASPIRPTDRIQSKRVLSLWKKENQVENPMPVQDGNR